MTSGRIVDSTLSLLSQTVDFHFRRITGPQTPGRLCVTIDRRQCAGPDQVGRRQRHHLQQITNRMPLHHPARRVILQDMDIYGQPHCKARRTGDFAAGRRSRADLTKRSPVSPWSVGGRPDLKCPFRDVVRHGIACDGVDGLGRGHMFCTPPEVQRQFHVAIRFARDDDRIVRRQITETALIRRPSLMFHSRPKAQRSLSQSGMMTPATRPAPLNSAPAAGARLRQIPRHAASPARICSPHVPSATRQPGKHAGPIGSKLL